MGKLKLFGIFTGREIKEDLEFNFDKQLIPNAKYELWCIGAFVQKVVSVRNRVIIKDNVSLC